MCLEIICLIYMNKKYLALNNLQWLICHKTQPNQTKPNPIYLIYNIYLFQTILLSVSIVFCLQTVKCQKQLYFKQFRLAYKNSSISSNSV